MIGPRTAITGALVGAALSAPVMPGGANPAVSASAIYTEAARTAGCGDRAAMARDLAAIQAAEQPNAVLQSSGRATNPDGSALLADLDLGVSIGPFGWNELAGGWTVYGHGGDSNRLDDSARATAEMLCANGYASDRQDAIRQHNGSGPAARAYATKVITYSDVLPDLGAKVTTPRAGLTMRLLDGAVGWAVDAFHGLRPKDPQLASLHGSADRHLVALTGETTNPAAGMTNSQGLDPVFEANLARMIADADKTFGPGSITIYSGRRSPAVQAELFAEAVLKYGSSDAARQYVAPSDGVSCSSQHCRGLAADLAFDAGPEAWAHKNADRYGLTFPMSYERWHVEPTKGSRSI